MRTPNRTARSAAVLVIAVGSGLTGVTTQTVAEAAVCSGAAIHRVRLHTDADYRGREDEVRVCDSQPTANVPARQWDNTSSWRLWRQDRAICLYDNGREIARLVSRSPSGAGANLPPAANDKVDHVGLCR